MKTCQQCGEAIAPTKGPLARYCSRSCSDSARHARGYASNPRFYLDRVRAYQARKKNEQAPPSLRSGPIVERVPCCYNRRCFVCAGTNSRIELRREGGAR